MNFHKYFFLTLDTGMRNHPSSQTDELYFAAASFLSSIAVLFWLWKVIFAGCFDRFSGSQEVRLSEGSAACFSQSDRSHVAHLWSTKVAWMWWLEMELLKKMVLWLDPQLLLIAVKMCVLLCPSVPSPLTCWAGQFIAVTDAQGFQRTTASVNNATGGGGCLFRANGQKEAAQVFWKVGWGKREMGTKFRLSGL